MLIIEIVLCLIALPMVMSLLAGIAGSLGEERHCYHGPSRKELRERREREEQKHLREIQVACGWCHQPRGEEHFTQWQWTRDDPNYLTGDDWLYARPEGMHLCCYYKGYLPHEYPDIPHTPKQIARRDQWLAEKYAQRVPTVKTKPA